MTKALHELTIGELTDLYNQHAPSKIKKFSDKATAVRRTAALLKEEGVKFPKPKRQNPKGQAKKKNGAPSRMSLIRDLFSRKKKASRQEIMDATGWDERNAHTAMSILKNPERTKEPLVTEYDRKTKTYTLVDG